MVAVMAKTRAEIQRAYRERKRQQADDAGDVADALEALGLLRFEDSCDPKQIAVAMKNLLPLAIKQFNELKRLKARGKG